MSTLPSQELDKSSFRAKFVQLSGVNFPRSAEERVCSGLGLGERDYVP